MELPFLVGQWQRSEEHGGIRSLCGDCILALLYPELPLSYYHGRNIIPPTYDIQKFIYYTHTCYELFSIEEQTTLERILILIHTCSAGPVKAAALLPNPWHRAEGRGWLRSQWIDYILPSPSKHCHEMAKTYYIFMHTYIHT